MNEALVRPIRTIGILVATGAMVVATAATATAAPATDPPGPVRDLVLSPVSGNGARGLGFEASWTPPADNGGGIRTHYVVEAHDATGARLESTVTGGTTVGPVRGDRCRAPLSFSVHAVTQDPQSGAPIAGPDVRADFGKLDLCAIHDSITATQTAPGTLQVEVTREAPIDPYVSGPSELTVDGTVAWTGTSGGTRGRTITVSDLAPGEHHLVLTTTSPRGDRYTAETTAVTT